MVIVIVLLLLLYTGGFARLRLELRTGWPFCPNQYSGRYIRYSNWFLLSIELCALSMNGKIQSGTRPAGSANVATPPFFGLPPLDDPLDVLLPPEQAPRMSALAATPAAKGSRRLGRRRGSSDI